MERKQISIMEVQDKQGQKGPFKTLVDSGGKHYAVFDTILFPAIIANTTIDAEYEEKQNGEYTNRTIRNIFKDGVAMVAPRPAFGGGRPGGGFVKDSASIEQQVAAKELGEAIRANIEVPADLTVAYWSWIRTRMAAKPAATTPAPVAPQAAKPVALPNPSTPAVTGGVVKATAAALVPDEGEELFIIEEPDPPKTKPSAELSSLWAAIANGAVELKVQKSVGAFMAKYAVEVKEWVPGAVPEGLTVPLATNVKKMLDKQREVIKAKAGAS